MLRREGHGGEVLAEWAGPRGGAADEGGPAGEMEWTGPVSSAHVGAARLRADLMGAHFTHIIQIRGYTGKKLQL